MAAADGYYVCLLDSMSDQNTVHNMSVAAGAQMRSKEQMYDHEEVKCKIIPKYTLVDITCLQSESVFKIKLKTTPHWVSSKALKLSGDCQWQWKPNRQLIIN